MRDLPNKPARQGQSWAWIEHLAQDVRYAVRGLLRDRAFSAAAILTLALGIGATTAVFSVADRMFIRPLAAVALPSGVRRLYVESNWTVGGVTEITPDVFYPAVPAFAAAVGRQAQVTAYLPPDTMPLVHGNLGSIVRGSYVGGQYFALLGVRPAYGRLIDERDDRMGQGAFVVVISYGLWQRVFGSDPSVVGRTVTLAHQPYTVIGVAPPQFSGVDLTVADAWIPLATLSVPGQPDWYDNWRMVYTHVLMRPARGTTDAWMSAVGTTVYRRGMAAHETRHPDTTATVLVGPIQAARGPSLTPEPAIAITERLIAVALLVLLIACANVANLLLVRAGRRQREVAIRAALGVSRGRLLRQLLTEGILLAVVAGSAAVVAAEWVGAALRATVLPDVAWAGSVVGGRVLTFALLVAVGTGALAGAIPAIRATRPDVMATLRRGGAEGRRWPGLRTQDGLMIVQVALATVLLAGAGLFVRSLRQVQQVPLGYDLPDLVFGSARWPDSLGRVTAGLPSNAARGLLATGLPGVAERLARDPDVASVATTGFQPMREYVMTSLFREDGSALPDVANRDPAVLNVSPGFFRASGLAIERGRGFTPTDAANAPDVVVVNQTAARTYWPGLDPLGQCLRFFAAKNPCSTVVGVAEDGHLTDVNEGPRAVQYVPYAQFPLMGLRWVIARARPGRTAAVAAAVHTALQQVFPEPAIPRVETGRTHLRAAYRPWAVGAELFGVLGFLALAVSAVGVYGVVASTMSQRTREMAIRIALGGQAPHIYGLVLGHGTRTLAIGVALGAAFAWASGNVMASLLYGTTPHDPIVLGAVSLLLGAVGLAASIVPARRAMRVDPASVLRAE